jgi:hypothetical protein
MGCGCGGSSNASAQAAKARQQEAASRPALTGPRAPGYTWDGPEGASAKPADKPAAKPAQ